jgi:hypothetical protein
VSWFNTANTCQREPIYSFRDKSAKQRKAAQSSAKARADVYLQTAPKWARAFQPLSP